MSLPPGTVVRRFEARDRAAVRFLCCETGFLGKPIDPVFEDRELFADYLTSYYTDIEPESCFVLEQNGRVVGYLLGSRRPLRQQIHGFFQNIRLFFKGMSRYPRYKRATRDFIGWILRNSWREVPAAPRRTAHFHFNVLPEAQSVAGMAGTSVMMTVSTALASTVATGSSSAIIWPSSTTTLTTVPLTGVRTSYTFAPV
jgi:hypothetical protein